MIEHHARRADHIPSRSREIFPWPEDSEEHRLIGKHLTQRTAVAVNWLFRMSTMRTLFHASAGWSFGDFPGLRQPAAALMLAACCGTLGPGLVME